MQKPVQALLALFACAMLPLQAAPPTAIDLGDLGDGGSVVTFDTIGSAVADTELGVYDAAGNLLDENDDIPGGILHSRVVAQNLAEGTYYAAVSAYNTTFGPVDFAVAGGGESGEIVLNYSDGLDLAGTATGSLDGADEVGGVAWFSFEIGAVPVSALDLLRWTTTDGEVTITHCNRAATGELVIPVTIEGNPVTSIGDLAFNECLSLTSIIIPGSVTSIGLDAFSESTSLASITIPDSVTSIGDWAFWNCTGLTSVTIGNSVTSMGSGAFQACPSLTSITIPDSVTSIGDQAFLFCSSLATITIPDGVTSIGGGAFSSCTSLTTIVVGAGNVNYTVVDGLLFNTEMTLLHAYPAGKIGNEYNIPDSVTSIGNRAFHGCSSLTSITIPDSVTSIGDWAFWNCNSLTSITIPDGVTSIGRLAFRGCSALASITIPDGVTSIGDQAFLFCSSLTSITIPDGVTSIGVSAFGDCSSLATITFLGSAPTTVGDNAFSGVAANAQAIVTPDAQASFGEVGAAWNGLTLGAQDVIPPTAIDLGTLWDGGSVVTFDTIGSAVEDTELGIYDAAGSLLDENDDIGGGVLHSEVVAQNLAEGTYYAAVSAYNTTFGPVGFAVAGGGESGEIVLNYSDGLDLAGTATGSLDGADEGGGVAWFSFEIGAVPVSALDLLTWTTTDGEVTITDCDVAATGELVIPDTIEGNPVISIGDSAFNECSSLTSITIPDSVTSIGIDAFSESTSLTSITIPDSVTSIGEWAFWNCNSLTSVTIGHSVTSIGPGAFQSCPSLTSITIPDSVTSIGIGTFQNCTGLTSITIGDGVTSIGIEAFRVCSSLTSITIPDSVTSIGNGAFWSCSSLTSVTIGHSVTSIGTGAFLSCTNLATITIPESVTSIGGGAFSRCSSLTTIVVGAGNVNYTVIDGVLFNTEMTLLHTYPAAKIGNEYNVPDGVTSIGNSAFRECSSLASITIGDGVESIGTSAFQSCSSLEAITFLGSAPTTVGDNAFSGVAANAQAIVTPEAQASFGEVGATWNGLTLLAQDVLAPPTAIDLGILGDDTSDLTLDTIGSGVGDTELGLYDAAGNLLEDNDDIGGGISHSELVVGNLSEGTYYVAVSSYDTTFGSADFTVSGGGESGEIVLSYSDGLDVAGAATVSLDGADEGGGVAWFSFEILIPPTAIDLGILGDETSELTLDTIGSAVEDTELGLYDATGNLLDDNDDASEGIFHSALFPRNLAEGTYYAAVSAYNTTFGPADFAVAGGGESGEVVLNYSDGLDLAGTGTGSLDGADEVGGVAWFSFEIGAGPVSALDLLTWTTTDGEVTITECDVAATGELVIPNTIEGNPVTSIGQAAFFSCRSLTSITIPDSITSIGDWAFWICSSLTSVTIGDGAESIGTGAFSECISLTSITIPDSVTSIGGAAFSNCSSLTTIGVGAGNVDYTGVDGVLFNTEMTLLHTYPAAKTGNEYTIPEGVTSIGDDTFFKCTSLATITIPDSVISIGAQAFWSCSNLSSITIPDSVASIGDSAFRYCSSLEAITFLGSAPTTVGDNAFSGMAANAQAIATPEAQASFGEVGAAWNGLLVGTQETAPPPNNLVANAQIITSLENSGSVTGTNVNATNELVVTIDEFESYRSVWYKWEAPTSGILSVSVVGEFDTQLVYFTGGADDTVSYSGASDNFGEGSPEFLHIRTVEGSAYWFRVSSADDLSGEFTLEWESSPSLPNDLFENAQIVSGVGDFGSLIGTNVKATMEQGEPTETAGWDSGSSVWYLWEAPATGTFSMRARGDFDTQLALFGGESTSSLEDLTLLDESDPQDSTGDSLVTWDAIDGVSYWLRVTGYNVVEFGDFTLDWSIHPVFQPVYTFAASTGRWPRQMLQGVDGYSYGVAIIGGAGDLGTIFRLSPDGEVSTLAEFTGGEGPVFGRGGTATLLQCRDGEFYGTTSFDEQYTFFTMTPQGDFTTLYQFPEGVSTWGGLIQGSDGDFYGHTVNGGEEGRSTVFKLSPTGAFTHIASFSDRMYPQSALIEDPEPALIEGLDGNFYGTTQGGGAFDAGTIFKVTLEGTITTLFEFGALYGVGVGPYSLMQDWDGNFYGTTNWGGDRFDGSVFRMTAEGVYTELVSFDGPLSGSGPANGLIQGSDGSLYGTTQDGGASDNGTVFRVTVAGALTTLVEFTGSGGGDVGSIPNGLVLGGNGELYGTTEEGGFGSNNVGTAFRIDPDGTLTTLVDFASLRGGGVGAAPLAALVRGRDGNFYGTTYFDGATDSGTIFRMTPAGITTRLAEFTGNAGPLPGRGPQAPLVEGIDGSFYGVTSEGGINNTGTVFRITSSGEVVTLFEFGRFEGSPEAPLAQGSDGHFYGTTVSDGTGEAGTVFRITADGAFATVIEFSGVEGPNRGSHPKSALTLAGNGNLYGTTASGGLNNEGTVFMITPEGELTTLVDFSGEGDPSPGSAPLGALGLGSDGNLYGTTSEGGPQDDGTIFRMTEAGEFTSLFAFGGSEAEDHGSAPAVALVEGGDGNFYGMANPGGRFENETIYMMTPQGVVTTFHEFQESEAPQGPVVAGPDGDFYGVQATDGTAGQIYRMVFRGIPTTYLLESPKPNEGLDRTSATVRSSINPRGALITEVRIEYGTDGATFPSARSIPILLAGYQGITVGRTLENLEPGTNYFYRFRVSSDLGESVSQVQTLSTLAEPEVAITPVSEVTPISARLNGTVNARNFDSVVTFEYGLDGNDFLNSVAIDPTTTIEGIPDIEQLAGLRIVRGSDDTDVSAQIAGLEAGRTYYYRLVAASVGGFAVSGQGSFRTLTPPVAELGGAEALSTTRVGVHGTVDALGSEVTAIYFEYWSEGQTIAEATLETATPDSASGEGATEVAATLTGLIQGTTYSYRIRAVGPGGTGLSETGTFSLSLLSGLDQTFPDPPNIANGEVTVTLTPSDIGGWRFAGEGQWRNSGETVGNLASGDRQIEYRPAAGYNRPPSELISVASGENVELERAFFSTPTSGEGILTVYLKPENLAATEVPEANRAQWRFLGDEDWQDGEVTIGGLVPGTYLVESKPVDNRVTPPATSVTVENGVPSTLTLTYFSANERTGQGPVLRSFTDVSTDEDLPLAYLGQIRSSAGSSTGFVVKRRVVATAGHVVFDDGSLSFISDLQWLFQRHATEYEPRPQTPRGFYLASGYAGARQAEGVVPGVGTPESQDLDYAVLYFQEEAGRGGVAGFLASDAGDENEFLTSSADKILAGYPVDSIPVTDLGKVHATPLFDESLTPAHGETWTTSNIYGMGGISGGPLFVRQSDGAFYPAAIYLGGDSQAVVRAIDSDVVELFLRAEASGNGGENNTGGGITHTSVAGNLSSTEPGALRVVIEPASANEVGAGWKLVPEATPRPTGASIYGLNPGTYNLVFLTVNGFQAPEMQAVEVTGGQLNTVTFTYEADHVASPLETWRQDNFGTISNSGDAADDADPDQDGVTNINEYTAETDPNDPESYPTRILTITNPTNGTVSGGGTYKLGAEANVEAIPALGYIFTTWTDAASGNNNPLALVMYESQTVGAVFERDLRDPDEDGLSNYQELVVHGTDPNNADSDGDGFNDGIEVAENSEPNGTGSYPTRVLTATNPTNGTVTGGGTYRLGTVASVEASTALGYLFIGWSGDASGADNPLAIVMDANRTVRAVFEPDQHDPDQDGLSNYLELVVHGTDPDNADNDGDGFNDGVEIAEDSDPTDSQSYPTRILTVITPNNGSVGGGGTYGLETDVTLQAIPAPGYLFFGWTGNGSGTDNPLNVTMDGNQTVGAVFEQDQRDPDQDGLSNYQELVVHGTDPDIADSDGDGFNDGLEIAENSDPTDPQIYPTRILTVSDADNGTVRGGGVYGLGTVATLEAIPAPGHVFAGWSGDATGSDNPLTIVIDGNQTVGAIFTQDDQDSEARLVKVTFNEDLTAANLFLEGLTPGQVYHVTGTVDGGEFFRFSDSEFTPDARDLEVNQPVDVASRRNLLLKVMEGPIPPEDAIK